MREQGEGVSLQLLPGCRMGCTVLTCFSSLEKYRYVTATQRDCSSTVKIRMSTQVCPALGPPRAGMEDMLLTGSLQCPMSARQLLTERQAKRLGKGGGVSLSFAINQEMLLTAAASKSQLESKRKSHRNSFIAMARI